MPPDKNADEHLTEVPLRGYKPPEDCLTIYEFATEHGMDPNTIRAVVKRGKLNGYVERRGGTDYMKNTPEAADAARKVAEKYEKGPNLMTKRQIERLRQKTA